MLEAFFTALQYFTDPSFMMWVLGGVIVGLIVGILPGIGGMSTLAMFLPFTFVLRPEQALPFMIAVSATTFTGGVITAVLIGVPGDAPNAASLLDGFPMTQKGEGGRALGAALMSSGLGGLVSGLLALIMVPVVVTFVYAITSADMVFVVLLGILCIGGLSIGSITKGVISGGFGLLISFIGFEARSGIPRYTFGSLYLYGGLPLLPLVMGLFAMPVIIDLVTQGGTIAQTAVVIKGMRDVWQGGKDILRNAGVFIRGTIIGYIVGIIPGIGAQTATFVSYGQAKATSKNPEKYGTGTVEGVIAASSACNASLGGDLIVTLALGIPGSVTMAVLLGGMLMVGLIPGPGMLTDHLGLSLSLMYIVVVANIIGVVICLFFIPQLVKIATIPARILVPLILPIIFVGAFTANEEFTDLIVLATATVFGVAMGELGYSRPALFLGYILGNLFEKYFFIAYSVAGPLFFMRPISLALIAIMLGMITYSPLKNLFRRLVR